MPREFYDPRAPACRAPRFLIALPIRYRTADAPDWHDGHTENISRSGVLIRTRDVLPSRTPIDMLFALPEEVGGCGATVICRGHVVRTESALDDRDPTMAATIVRVRNVQPQNADPRRI